jgi:hypothetical protein
MLKPYSVMRAGRNVGAVATETSSVLATSAE